MAGGFLVLQGPRVGCRMVEGPWRRKKHGGYSFQQEQRGTGCILDSSDPSAPGEVAAFVSGVVLAVLPLALIISEIFNPSASKLELDLGFSAGKSWTASQCLPNLKNFSKMVIVPLGPLEHDLELREHEGDHFGGWDRSLCQGCLWPG